MGRLHTNFPAPNIIIIINIIPLAYITTILSFPVMLAQQDRSRSPIRTLVSLFAAVGASTILLLGMMSMIPARRRLAEPVESSEDLEPVEPKDHDRIPAAEPVNLEPKDDDRLTKREEFL